MEGKSAILRHNMITKTCNKCKKTYPATLDFFHRKKTGKFGLRAKCKICRKLHEAEKNKIYKKKYRSTLWGCLKDVWYNLNYRCSNPKAKDYKRYGGRGIENRFKSFEDFYDYVTQVLKITTFKQIKGLEIDRIDNNGNYELDNIRFIPHAENMRNTRRKSKYDIN